MTSSGSRTFSTDAGHTFTVDHYFCSGVMVFNIDKWKTTNLDERCLEFVLKECPVLPDQDALNVICSDELVFIENKYQVYQGQNSVVDRVFLHFAGTKPWCPWFPLYFIDDVNSFRKACKLFEPDVTQWISFKPNKNTLVNFNHFHARKAMKWLSQLFYKRKNYKAFLYFYFKHLQIKVKQKGLLGILLFKSTTRSK